MKTNTAIAIINVSMICLIGLSIWLTGTLWGLLCLVFLVEGGGE